MIQAKIVEIEKIKLNVIPGTIFSVTRIFFLSLFEQENLVFQIPLGSCNVRRSIKRDRKIIFLFSLLVHPMATEAN